MRNLHILERNIHRKISTYSHTHIMIACANYIPQKSYSYANLTGFNTGSHMMSPPMVTCERNTRSQQRGHGKSCHLDAKATLPPPTRYRPQSADFSACSPSETFGEFREFHGRNCLRLSVRLNICRMKRQTKKQFWHQRIFQKTCSFHPFPPFLFTSLLPSPSLMSFKSFMSPVPSCHVPSFSVPLRSSSENRISLKSFFQPTKSLPLNKKWEWHRYHRSSTRTHRPHHMFHVFICFPCLFRIISWFFIVFVENVISCHIIASLLDIHQKGFDRCLTSKPLENWICWLEDSWVFICFYGFLRGFSWFFCLVTHVKVYKNGSEGLDPPLQVPHRASPTHKPAISIFDPISIQVDVTSPCPISLCFISPQWPPTLPIFWYQGCQGLPKALVEAGEVSNSN